MAGKFGSREIENLILSHLPFSPTCGQRELVEALSAFIIRFRSEVGFVLQGYAGTGKTSVIGALVKALPALNITPVLLAPTGRAAKVLSAHAGAPAYTIHKQIYYSQSSEEGTIKTALRHNRSRNTLYIVDEASMLGEEAALLDDFFRYVGTGYRCRALMLGDTAQLPPVGSPYSPALETEYLQSTYPFDFLFFRLEEVLRQAQDSLVLENATTLRRHIADQNISLPLFHLHSSTHRKDLIRLCGEDLEETLQNEYGKREKEDIVFITRSNKRANLFNNEIRARIFCSEGEIAAGELLMVLKNNYYWLPDTSKAGFIANGDMIEVLKVKRREELYGFRFADIEARLVDYPDEPPLELKIMLDALQVEAASLPYSRIRNLFEQVLADYAHLPTKAQRMEEVRKNPYFNALQVKYAYALTCHKTQGGQWPCVFIEQGYFTDDMFDTEYLRWLYTALTRTVEKAYLLNFSDKFFEEGRN